MSSHDDIPETENKPVNLSQFRQAAYTKSVDKIDDKVWQDLCTLWGDYANSVSTMPTLRDGFRRSESADAVFSVLLDDFVSLAQAKGVSNESIIWDSLSSALIQCEPEGRLHELIDRAWNLLDSGDEEAGEKLNAMCAALDALKAQGMNDEEAFAALKAQSEILERGTT
jgi:hypothetical protein